MLLLKVVGTLLLTSIICKVSGLTVSVREKLSKIDTSTVYHVEEDIGDPEQVIYASYQSLNTLKKGRKPRIIVGNDEDVAHYREGQGNYARFKYISSFHQINSTLIIVVDKLNHCLRLVDKSTSITKQFAGKCTVSHFHNGVGTEARFSSPHAVIPGYYKYEYYVTDSNNNAVRLLQVSPDYQNVSVSTVKRDDHQLITPTGLALDPNNHQLLVLSGFHLVRIQFSKEKQAALSVETLSKSCSVIIALPSINLFLMTGTKDNAIYQVTMNDFQTRRVGGDYSNGNCGDSKKWYSLSLSNSRSTLYAGSKKCIERLTVTDPVPEYNRTVERRPTPEPVSISMVETTTNKISIANIAAAESDKGVSNGDGIVFSFANWTGYAFLAMVVALVALIVAFVAVILKHRRSAMVRRVPRENAAPVPPVDGACEELLRPPTLCPVVQPYTEVLPHSDLDLELSTHFYEYISSPQARTGTDDYLTPISIPNDNNSINNIVPESPLLMEESKAE